MALKYGNKDVGAVKFNAPLTPEPEYKYDFANDWIINPAQPEGGIEIVNGHTITITKFKPNEWFVKSTYNDMTQTNFTEKFLNINWILSGIIANSNLFSFVTLHPAGDQSATYYATALVISPINSNGTLMSNVYPWDMNIPGGKFKGGVSGWNYYGYKMDGTVKLYNQECYWGGYNQVGLAFYTNEATDNDGYITLLEPIVLSLPNISEKQAVDPTTVESFVVKLNDGTVYEKEKTYANILSAYGFSFKEVGNFTDPIQGGDHGPAITSHYPRPDGVDEQHTAFVIKTNNWDAKYPYVRLPEIIDFEDLIRNKFPFKFWARLSREDARSHIWDSLVNAFENEPITDGTFASYLFAKSSGNGKEFIDSIHLTFKLPDEDEHGNPIDSYIDMTGMFDHSNLFKNVRITIQSGVLKSLVDVFRQTTMTSVTFDTPVRITDWSGAFEGVKMTSFPTNVTPGHQWNGRFSETTTDMHYAADGSRLQWFGVYKDENALTDDDKYYTALVTPAVYGMISRSDIQEIRYLMDFKFVIPKSWCINDRSYNNAVFNSSNLVTAKIKNLNKGNWSLDGVARLNQNVLVPDGETICCGNLPNLDADSVNYMLNNIFDLKQNDQTTGDTAHFENELNSFNDWALSSGTKCPVVFETWPNTTSTFSKTLSTGGQMKVKVGLTNCTATITNGGTTVALNGGEQTLNLVAGSCTFTFTKTGDNAKASMELTEDFRFKYELTPGLTGANIYFPSGFDAKIDEQALRVANSRGWNVYVGGNLLTPTSIVGNFIFELDGGAYATNNSYDVIQFNNNAGYSDAFTMTSLLGAANTGFESGVIGTGGQQGVLTATNASDQYMVTFYDDDVNKEMEVQYIFEGSRENNQTIALQAAFKNLSTNATKTVQIQEGSAYYSYLDLSDWFVANDTVRIQVSFDFVIS